MSAIHAIWKDGQIVPTEPVDWPEGTELTVEPVDIDEPDDPATIAERLAAYQSLPPMIMTLEEEAEWQAARQAMKEYTIAKMRGRPIEDRP